MGGGVSIKVYFICEIYGRKGRRRRASKVDKG